jgi:DnaJ-class molecular chaperone
MPTHYETLGLSRDASESDIKKAYRALSLKWHPDRNPAPEAQATFQEIGQAYEILSDEGKRSEYNNELDGGNGNHFFRTNSMSGHHDDIGNLFNMMFGQGNPFGQGGPFGQGTPFGQGGPFGQGTPFGQAHEVHFGPGGPQIHIFRGGGGMPHHFFQQQLQKPPPIIKTAEISLEQAYSGCVLHLEIDKWTLQNDLKINELEMVYVNIPAGIDNEEIIIMRDCGNTVNANLKGDVKWIVKIQPSSVFERYGMDLIHKKTITLKESLTGFSFDLLHVNGKTLCLNNHTNRTIVKPGFKKHIPNLGMMRDGKTGNLIIEFTIQFPDSLTEDQMAKLADVL